MHIFELPTTGAVSFHDLCIDNAGVYTARIADATSARANVRAILKETRHSDGDRDHLRIIKVIDDYLPHLYAIMACLDADELTLRNEPVFSWRSTLSSNVFNSSPRMDFPGIKAELTFTLLTFAFSLCNMAASTVSSLEFYEREIHISEAEHRQKDERLNFAVTLLCRACGIFSHLAEATLPSLHKSSSGNLPRVPDLSKEVITGLTKLCLAEAQSLAIRKLLSKAAFESSLSPGPPLPKSHPSPALIAKLYLEVSSLYTSALSLVKTPGSSKTSSPEGVDGDVNGSLRKYLADEGLLATALSHKWLGVESGELGRSGEAVAYLSWAKDELDSVKQSRGKLPILTSGAKKGKEKSGDRKERTIEEVESVSLFLDTYRRENNTVNFFTVPTRAAVQALIPPGRVAVAPKLFVAPVPAFGPGSIERITGDAGKPDPGSKPQSPTGRYAGIGSYF